MSEQEYADYLRRRGGTAVMPRPAAKIDRKRAVEGVPVKKLLESYSDISRPRTVDLPVTIVLPLPPMKLMPNRVKDLHWGQKSRIAAAYRLEVWAEARKALGVVKPVDFHVVIDLKYVFDKHRQRDDDNLTAVFKAGRDGLTDAGLWLDDRLVTTGSVQALAEPGKPRLEVTIRKK